MKPFVLALSVLVWAGCGREGTVSSAQSLLDHSALVIVGVREEAAVANYRLSEILKNDGTLPLRYKVGDSLRLGSSVSNGKRVGDMRIVFVGKEERGDDLMSFHDLSTMEIFEGRIPGLDCASLENLRALAHKR